MWKLNIPPEEKRIFTISNFVTVSRILLLPFVLFLIKAPPTAKNNLIMMGLLALALASDFLDGYIARKRNQISILGKILDPLSDKICIGFAVVFAVIYRDLPVWIAVVVIARDVIILLAGLLIMNKKRFISVSNIYGKYTVTIIAFLIISYLLRLSFLHLPLTILAIVAIFVSLVMYGRGFFVTMKS